MASQFRFGIWTISTLVSGALLAAPSVPTEIQQPGTQPGEVSSFQSPDNCDNCHDDVDQPNPGTLLDRDPSYGWRGGMMAHAGRDALFWATMAIAEQDFLPGTDPAARGGAGDLCLRCHSVNGWIGERSTPTNGSALTSADQHGIECEFCHLLVDPDPPVSIAGTVEQQAAVSRLGPSDLGALPRIRAVRDQRKRYPPRALRRARRQTPGSRIAVPPEGRALRHLPRRLQCGGRRSGPQPRGDEPLAPGTFSGVPGSPVTEKAAFNNPPYRYGIVERTFSEWVASRFDTTLVNDYSTLPPELQAVGGALDNAYHSAWDARGDADYEDGTPRLFTCQTCHMAASTGYGANKNNLALRTDLPRHDLTGSGYWMPDVVTYMDAQGTLRLGGGLDSDQLESLAAGKQRAADMLRSAADLTATQVPGEPLSIRVTNLTGHKLISGYPEGRRMWLNLRFFDATDALIEERGTYGPIGRTVADLSGTLHQIESLLDPHSPEVVEAKPGMDQSWAAALLGLGYPTDLALGYDRSTDSPTHTLGELAGSSPGTSFHTFHFVLNNVMTADNRIPPWGFDRDEALVRNALPVPETQFGSPGPGGTFEHWWQRFYAVPSRRGAGRGAPLLPADQLGVHPVPGSRQRRRRSVPRPGRAEPTGRLAQHRDVPAPGDGDGRPRGHPGSFRPG